MNNNTNNSNKLESEITERAEIIYNLLKQGRTPLNYIEAISRDIGLWFDNNSGRELCLVNCYVEVTRGETAQFMLMDQDGDNEITMDDHYLTLNNFINYYPEHDEDRDIFDKVDDLDKTEYLKQ